MLWIILLLLACGAAVAAPFAVSDPYTGTPQPTHCRLYLDGKPPIEAPIAKDAAGAYCKFDIAGVGGGEHVMTATHVLRDPTWGDQESAQSATVNFSKPVAPPAPAGFSIKP